MIHFLKYAKYPLYKLIYNINPTNAKIKIFGEKYIRNNKYKCMIIYNDIIFPLVEYFSLKNINKKANKLELLLIELEYNPDKSNMFHECDSLEQFSIIYDHKDFNKQMNNGIINQNNDESDNDDYQDNEIKLNLIYPEDTEVSYINSVEDIPSKIPPIISDINNEIILNEKELIPVENNIPKKSRYKTILDFTDISYMFYGCSSLISLSDISNWDTKNVHNMSCIFFGCSSLISLPDISKWNMKNITNMSGMFNGCTSLKSLPDISKWNLNKFINIKKTNNGDSSFNSLYYDNDQNLMETINMNGIFCECKSLLSLPDISKWDTLCVNNMSGMFYDCSLLMSLPDISIWNTQNVRYMSHMFHGCLSLKSLPDISKWNFNNVSENKHMFAKCLSLIFLPDIKNK